jgi:ABC-type multidrug transport system fused ATPase/permease subunit
MSLMISISCKLIKFVFCRLSTLTHVDKIVVIGSGKVIEEGTHDELLALNGFYTSLWNAQMGSVATTETFSSGGGDAPAQKNA